MACVSAYGIRHSGIIRLFEKILPCQSNLLQPPFDQFCETAIECDTGGYG